MEINKKEKDSPSIWRVELDAVEFVPSRVFFEIKEYVLSLFQKHLESIVLTLGSMHPINRERVLSHFLLAEKFAAVDWLRTQLKKKSFDMSQKKTNQPEYDQVITLLNDALQLLQEELRVIDFSEFIFPNQSLKNLTTKEIQQKYSLVVIFALRIIRDPISTLIGTKLIEQSNCIVSSLINNAQFDSLQ